MITQKREWNHKKTQSKKKRQKKRNKGTQNRWDKQKIYSKMVDLNPTVSTIRLNVNDLNIPIEREK